MKVGVILPQTELGCDASGVRDYAQAADQLGFEFLEVWDHVILPGAKDKDPGLRYHAETTFHEPLVLLGYLAAVTERIELATGVLILPQRQTVLVAKQAAEVDVLSSGRLRLGVGLGWLEMEYQVLGVEWRDRGRLIEEQIDLMRQLWSQPTVSWKGQFHVIEDAGFSPRPPAGAIPIWIGGRAEAALNRAARLADGWLPAYFGRGPDTNVLEAMATLRTHLQRAGRDPASFFIEGRIPLDGDPDRWASDSAEWKAAGASHLALNSMRLGLSTIGEHIALLERYARSVGTSL